MCPKTQVNTTFFYIIFKILYNINDYIINYFLLSKNINYFLNNRLNFQKIAKKNP